MSNRYIGGVVTETTNVAQSPWSGSWTEQAAMQGFGSVLKITNSLRFRASASAYLSRTPSVAGNQKTWTWSGWVKRGKISSSDIYLFGQGTDGNNFTALAFASNDTLLLWQYTYPGAGLIFNISTTSVYRDTSAWYHIVLAIDTNQATASNRVKLYVNGTQITAFSAANYPAQNLATYVNSTNGVAIGNTTPSTTNYFDGYMAEINFVDGQALEPTAFGAINKETGVWAPIAYAGTYGLNGFHLSFNNGTSTTTLGYDTSGNGNNWTTNNISLTAGSTYDWMIDSPSKIQGTGYGVGNYAVLNPLVRLNTNTAMTFSQANLVCVGNSAWSPALSTIQYPSTGKWYWEAIFNGTAYSPPGPTSNYSFVGVSNTSNTTNYGLDTTSALILGDTGYGNNFASANTLQYGSSIQSGAIVGIAIDRDANTFTFYVNNSSVWAGTINYTSGATLAPFVASYNGSYTTLAINFGQRPFAYTPPTGYKTLCTQNLPVATIYNGAQYMAATLWTGDGSNSRPISNTVNGVGFAPDFVWVKGRGTTTLNHALYDSVRGSNKNLSSSTTGAETSPSTYGGVGSFDASGFTLVNGTSGTDPVSEVNKASPYTYVGWSWKAGGTAVTNTAGTITSSVSANTTAGFSVVTYTGTLSSAGTATVGHGLGTAPSMIITKSRSATSDWIVHHVSLATPSYVLFLDTTSQQLDTSFNGTIVAPTSTVFTTNWTTGMNLSGVTTVAYCFAAIAGYSAFGSYTGNGSSDGPFVFLGFRPRWLLVKRSSTGGNYWILIDTSRGTYNVNAPELYPNASDAENAGSKYDLLSNGFKVRDSAAAVNASGDTYIYAAFAENPFSVALAR